LTLTITRGLPQLLRLKTPGLAQGEAWALGHHHRVSNVCSGDRGTYLL